MNRPEKIRKRKQFDEFGWTTSTIITSNRLIKEYQIQHDINFQCKVGWEIYTDKENLTKMKLCIMGQDFNLLRGSCYSRDDVRTLIQFRRKIEFHDLKRQFFYYRQTHLFQTDPWTSASRAKKSYLSGQMKSWIFSALELQSYFLIRFIVPWSRVFPTGGWRIAPLSGRKFAHSPTGFSNGGHDSVQDKRCQLKNRKIDLWLGPWSLMPSCNLDLKFCSQCNSGPLKQSKNPHLPQFWDVFLIKLQAFWSATF